MRARIIFRGLTLFTFERDVAGAAANDNLGTLTAHLVSDPAHAGMPLHEHTPYLGLLGREVGDPPGRPRVQTKGRMAKEITIGLKGHDLEAGVRVDGSFLDYVPLLEALNEDGRDQGLQDRFITRRITIPSGRIRTRDFISWDWHGNTPARIAYLDTNVQGFAANEVIVDVGDDSDFETPTRRKHLAIDSRDGGVQEKLWAYTRGDQYVHGIDPNTVEVLINNLPARRRRPVFWSRHFEVLFRAAGFRDRTSYRNAAQYEALQRAAMVYDADQWQADVAMMSSPAAFQPFPFLTDIDPQQDKLEPLAKAAAAYMLKGPPPPPAGRQQGEGLLRKAHRAHGHGGMGHDPANYEICPHAITDI
jgi:hypothetical protein